MKAEKLAVFRGLYLGDLVAAAPALRSLRSGYPRAEITLVSLPWAAALAPTWETSSTVSSPTPAPPASTERGPRRSSRNSSHEHAPNGSVSP
jgi:hypothetical protein